MREKYLELKGVCRTCLGCEKLADKKFGGYYKCKNYMRGAKDGKQSSK
jgi:hypothetical protein